VQVTLDGEKLAFTFATKPVPDQPENPDAEGSEPEPVFVE